MGRPLPTFCNDDANAALSSTVADLLQRANELISNTDALESEVNGLERGLEHHRAIVSQGSGRNMAAVQASRQLLNRIRVDHKALVCDIEQALRTLDETPSSGTSVSNGASLSRPAFAVISAVGSDSPADQAGLCKDDLIIRIGPVEAHNHDQLRAVYRYVRQNPDTCIDIEILRGQPKRHMVLVAKPQLVWGGGSLGCHIRALPSQNQGD